MKERDLIRLTIHRLGFLRPGEKALLEEVTDSIRSLVRLKREDLKAVIGRKFRAPMPDLANCLRQSERDLCVFERIGVTLYHIHDREYPPQLREIWDPPFMLFCRGKMPFYGSPLLGIVGTRYPSGKARKASFNLGFEAAAQGIGVVSGLARGIDSEAHSGTIKAGGYTCAVMGTGPDEVYPPENKVLARKILDTGGALLTEYLPSSPPLRHHFPERNRILSGLCRGVAVVEAPKRSGALITADFALDQGRDIFVHNSGLKFFTGDGTVALAADGARVIDSADDILHEWEIVPAKSGLMRRHTRDADETGRLLAKFLEEELVGEVLLHQRESIRR